MENGHPTHTPELLELFNAMQSANKALKKSAKSLASMRSKEYQIAVDAYRAYWNAVGLDKADCEGTRLERRQTPIFIHESEMQQDRPIGF